MKEKSNIYKFFTYDEQKKIQICQIERCTSTFKGSVSSNLLRHLKTKHNDIYLRFMIEKNKSDDDLKTTIKKNKREW